MIKTIKNIGRSALPQTSVMIALLLILTSCGFLLVPIRKEKVRSFSLRAVAEYGQAYDLAVKAAEDIHFNVTRRNKKNGTFEADRGYGFGEITILYFHLQKGYKRKFYFTVTVRSSKGSASVIKDFISSIEKYLDILPIMPQDKLISRKSRPPALN